MVDGRWKIVNRHVSSSPVETFTFQTDLDDARQTRLIRLPKI
jgi:hypothetical protein